MLAGALAVAVLAWYGVMTLLAHALLGRTVRESVHYLAEVIRHPEES